MISKNSPLGKKPPYHSYCYGEYGRVLETSLLPWLPYGNHAGSSGGFCEGKGTTFEGGQRVPCLVEWPGVIPGGVVCNNITAGMDMLPTIAEATGAALPKRKIDGVSLLRMLKGDLTFKPRETMLYYYRKNSLEAVRHGDWKLVFTHPGRMDSGFSPGKDGKPGPNTENYLHQGALYDLRRDPGERFNVEFDNPEIAAKLRKIADQAREDLGDDITGKSGNNRRQIGSATQ